MTSPVTGAVYKDLEFKFEDGGGKPKFIVILCSSCLDSKKVIAAVTTSIDKRRHKIPVCFQNAATLPPSCFYIGKQPNIFIKDTWLLFDQIREYDANGFRNSRFEHKGMLNISLTRDILNCAIQNSNRHLVNLVTRSIAEEIDVIKNL